LRLPQKSSDKLIRETPPVAQRQPACNFFQDTGIIPNFRTENVQKNTIRKNSRFCGKLRKNSLILRQNFRKITTSSELKTFKKTPSAKTVDFAENCGKTRSFCGKTSAKNTQNIFALKRSVNRKIILCA